MFLRNWDNYVMYILGAGRLSSIGSGKLGSAYRDGDLVIQTPSGSVTSMPMTVYSSSNSYYFLYNMLSLSKSYLCFGDGDTAVTYDDYRLSGTEVTTTPLVELTNTASAVYDYSKRAYVHKISYTYTNSTDNDVVIKEWGICTGTYSSTSTKVGLMCREVLAEPITIAAGSTATITLSLEVPLIHPATNLQ